MYQNCDAIIIRRRHFSETSYWLSLFTREFGRVDALAKGARRLRSPMFGHFDFLAREEITLFRRSRSGLDLATAAAGQTDFPHLRTDPRGFAAAGVIAEILAITCQLNDPHPALFAASADALNALDRGENLYKTLAILLPIAMRELGFAPRLDCCGCGEKIGEFANFSNNEQRAALSGRHGGLVCEKCWRGAPEKLLPRLQIKAVCEDSARQNGLRKHDGKQIIRAWIDYVQEIIGRRVAGFSLLEHLWAN